MLWGIYVTYLRSIICFLGQDLNTEVVNVILFDLIRLQFSPVFLFTGASCTDFPPLF